MNKRKVKRIRNIIVLILVIFSISNVGKIFWSNVESFLGIKDRYSISDQNSLNITFFDVGKADCIFIESDFCNIIIDGSTAQYADDILSHLNKRKIDKLDAIFITHFDSDHYQGLREVLKNINIEVIYTSSDSNYPYDSDFAKIVKEMDIEVKKLTYMDNITFGEINFEILSPQKQYENKNEMSLVSKLTYKDFSLLFTGDIENEAFADLLKLGEKLNSDILQIPHHGSKNATNKEFLTAVSPSLALISTGDNASNLPSVEVLDLLNDFSIPYYRTNTEDNILISTNANSKITISTKEKTYETTYN